jgi:hypothetical protein
MCVIRLVDAFASFITSGFLYRKRLSFCFAAIGNIFEQVKGLAGLLAGNTDPGFFMLHRTITQHRHNGSLFKIFKANDV